MTANACMRWSPGPKQSWRRVSEGGFDKRDYAVTTIDEVPARDWTLARHYSASWVNARLRYGLFDITADQERLAGVAVLSIPVAKPVLTNVFPHLAPYHQSLELGRLVLEDAAPANAETWFLKEVFRLAAKVGIRGVVSFSDPLPRYADCVLIMPGHVGTIYQAKGARYLDRATARTLAVFRDGQVFSAKAMQKIRDQDPCHEYAERQLVDRGARPMRPGEKPANWLAEALDARLNTVLLQSGAERDQAAELGSSEELRAQHCSHPGPARHVRGDAHGSRTATGTRPGAAAAASSRRGEQDTVGIRKGRSAS